MKSWSMISDESDGMVLLPVVCITMLALRGTFCEEYGLLVKSIFQTLRALGYVNRWPPIRATLHGTVTGVLDF
ncbi:hypothetical protein BDV97DRAFT_345323 [Delphinella strobiligena]|nr:hypothetical protein BDV97DRAFT_345323 [Delphinella strobiligena]